jgi:hypothetical protein
MKTTLRNSVSLVVAAVIGGLISQAIPLSMQLRADATTNAPAATTATDTTTTPPTTATNRNYGVIDVSTIKTAGDMAASLNSSAQSGWIYRGSVGNYAIFSEKVSK